MIKTVLCKTNEKPIITYTVLLVNFMTIIADPFIDVEYWKCRLSHNKLGNIILTQKS